MPLKISPSAAKPDTPAPGASSTALMASYLSTQPSSMALLALMMTMTLSKVEQTFSTIFSSVTESSR